MTARPSIDHRSAAGRLRAIAAEGRALLMRHRTEIVDACTAASGPDGAALAWALTDIAKDGTFPPTVWPVAEAVALLDAAGASSVSRTVRTRLARLADRIDAVARAMTSGAADAAEDADAA